MRQRDGASMFSQKITLQLFQKCLPRLGVAFIGRRWGFQIGHFQGLIDRIARSALPIIKGAKFGPRKPGPNVEGVNVRGGATLTNGGTDRASVRPELLGHERTERRVLNRALRQAWTAGLGDKGGPAVISLAWKSSSEERPFDPLVWPISAKTRKYGCRRPTFGFP